MNTKFSSLIVAITLVLGQSYLCIAEPVGSAFTHQGRLSEVNVPTTGTFDFEFKLYYNLNAGSQLGITQSATDVNVIKGLFTTQLDFGDSVFNGEARWIELAVKGLGDPGFTTLMPRQKLTPAPYAIYAKKAGEVAGGIGVQSNKITAFVSDFPLEYEVPVFRTKDYKQVADFILERLGLAAKAKKN